MPTYLRVVLTTRCNYSCSFCHMEGDPSRPGTQAGLNADEIVALAGAAVECGVRKVKLLGGEPLLRRDLPQIVSELRRRWADLDLSVITAG